MKDLAGSDKKIKALVKTVFDSSREKADLPDKTDIKLKRNKDDGTSLKYQKIE